MAIATTLANGVTSSDVNITDAVDAFAATFGEYEPAVTVSYEISSTSVTGFCSSSEAYDSLTGILSSSVEDGTFTSTMDSLAETNTVPGMSKSYSNKVIVYDSPTQAPTAVDDDSTQEPTLEPSNMPTVDPSNEPTLTPTDEPTNQPTNYPTVKEDFVEKHGKKVKKKDLAPTKKNLVDEQDDASLTLDKKNIKEEAEEDKTVSSSLRRRLSNDSNFSEKLRQFTQGAGKIFWLFL